MHLAVRSRVMLNTWEVRKAPAKPIIKQLLNEWFSSWIHNEVLELLPFMPFSPK